MDEMKEQIPLERWESPPCGMIGDIFSIFHEGKRETENIKDYKVFDLDYIPEKIILREQAREIAENMGAYITRGIVEHFLLSGLRGTGKTVTVRYLLREAEKFAEKENIQFKYYYISVRRHRSSYLILGPILSEEKEEKPRKPRGLSFSELWEKAKEKIEGKRTIIVLDEADFLKDDDILYFLTRETNSMVITIVTSPFWIGRLDDHVRSSFQPIFIHFSEYKYQELFEILKQRAEMGLHRYDERGIEQLADIIATDLHGDARYGILALKHLGKWDKWDEESVNKAVTKSVGDLELTLLESLNQESLYILDIISSYQGEIDTSELYSKFKEKYQSSKPTFFYHLNELEKLGLIGTIERKKGQPFAVRSLLNYPDLIKEVIKKKESLWSY
jgi:cell division control protein 6